MFTLIILFRQSSLLSQVQVSKVVRQASGANASVVKELSKAISRSKNPQARSPNALFSSEKLTTFFWRRPQNIGRWSFHCQNKTNKAVRYDNIFIFILVTLLPKQSDRQGGARAVNLPARSFDLARPGVAPPPLLSFILHNQNNKHFFSRSVARMAKMRAALVPIHDLFIFLTDVSSCPDP